MNWYLAVLRQYTNFEGRAHRSEFWWFTLWSLIISLGLTIIEIPLGVSPALSGVYALVVLLPTIAVGARRLHDIGRSGWWQLLLLIPLIGAIILIIWWAQEGDASPNEWGPNPWSVPQPAA